MMSIMDKNAVLELWEAKCLVVRMLHSHGLHMSLDGGVVD